MKIKIISFVLLITLSVISCNYRGEDGRTVDAATYSDGKVETGLNFAQGSNGGYTLNNKDEFGDVETQSKLTVQPPIPRGKFERAEEVPTVDQYYDGEISLNAIKVNCKMVKDPKFCTQQPQCGWCSENATCIVGNSLGPMEECPRSKYQFSFPGRADIPLRITNHDNGGAMLVRTYQKDGKN